MWAALVIEFDLSQMTHLNASESLELRDKEVPNL